MQERQAMKGAGTGTLRSLCGATIATLLVAGCAVGSATVTGTLVGSDGHCLYIDVANAHGSDRYWLRYAPSGYVDGADEHVAFVKPDGSVIMIGDSVTVTGTLSWLPFEWQCAGAHTLDATAID